MLLLNTVDDQSARIFHRTLESRALRPDVLGNAPERPKNFKPNGSCPQALSVIRPFQIRMPHVLSL